jgi:hypothetical protein
MQLVSLMRLNMTFRDLQVVVALLQPMTHQPPLLLLQLLPVLRTQACAASTPPADIHAHSSAPHGSPRTRSCALTQAPAL